MKLPPHLIRVALMLGPYKKRLALALLGMVLTAATEPMFPAVMKVLLDRGFVGKPTVHIWMVPLAVIGIFVMRGISTFMTSYMMTWVCTRLLNLLRQQAYDRILEVPLGFYTTNSV